ncbi:Dpy-30 motif-containing protein [Giardia muris]|uniref:Dpy-30 motif-containing protein n=1 Tax=Giardia muris TaxID=5742 RepID=A0A4Z1SVM6_GIAMU|nr:Dpy-30 motif-containing protein [Giardia muris]|eukprot:TNJ29690.1 Dpy-30 motif-containing protein [Giardia muris]
MDLQIDRATTNYLTEAVGEQLSNACAEAICRKPHDAIEFIGNYLIEASKEFEG